jgi:DNA polymerase-3 subunit beta
MKFSAQTDDLLKELQLLQSIVERKTTIPILSNLLMKTSKDEVELEATDLEVGLRCKAPASISTEGKVTINARKIYDLIRSLPSLKLDMELVDNNNLRLSGPNVDYKITVLPAEEYPGIPDTAFNKPLTLPADGMRDALAKTIIASAVDDTRYTLNGIFMRAKKEGFTLVATDAHRLALCTVKGKLDIAEEEISFIIPRKGAQEVSNLVRDKGGDEPLLFMKEENNLFFKHQDRFLVTRIIEGNYPQFEKVIPQDNQNIATVDRQMLQKTISRVDLVASEKSHAIILEFSGDGLIISSSSPEFGEGKENMKIGYEGEKIRIAFNARYLIDFLNTASTEKVVLKLKDGKTATAFLEEGSEDYLYVVSPIKL